MDLSQIIHIATCVLALGLHYSAALAKDTREGENVSLECRFAPQLSGQEPTYFWIRKNKSNQDNVAIRATPLDENYKVDFRPELGRYDLNISNVSFIRDDGTFECRVKAAGSGRDLHSQAITLTVLTQPGPPQTSGPLTPDNAATEGVPVELKCSSRGGSPAPTISWFRDGGALTDAKTATTPGRDSVTTSTLTVRPTMNDDGAVFKCVVWNRAMTGSEKFEAKLQLKVNYFPRVQVGPENPLRVERDTSASLHCTVQSKPSPTSIRWTRDGNLVSTAPVYTIPRVTQQNAGQYVCTADNGLGTPGQAQLTLDVLYPPEVSIEATTGTASHRETEENESVSVKCSVQANPAAASVEWVRASQPDFRRSGSVLRLDRVTADDAGGYTCRATNVIDRTERTGNASITLLVRHKPGRASISPERPAVPEGSPMTLTCSADPPGWPAPMYKWWREDGAMAVLATGQKLTVSATHLASEGDYNCQASNEMGLGQSATVRLQVFQPPRFLSKLSPHVTKRMGDSGFSVTCGVQGKPEPSVKWLKDGYELTDSADVRLTVESSKGHSGVFTVQGTLEFVGQLTAGDRGLYVCALENQVKRVESSMQLRIEHEPIALHRHGKAAYDIGEAAEVVCRVQAYPRPDFSWSFGGETRIGEVTSLDGDVYASVLRLPAVSSSDYGEYTCRSSNSLGTLHTVLRLQPKGPPEHPATVAAVDAGPHHVTLRWDPGFDGGISNTKFFVSYRREVGNAGAADCSRAEENRGFAEWQEFDCQRNNPCNVTALDQHRRYSFKVKAINTKGNSNYSAEVQATTRVDRISAPQRVRLDPYSRHLTVDSGANCLELIALVEASDGTTDQGQPRWQLVKTIDLAPSVAASRTEVTLPATAGPGDEVETDGDRSRRRSQRVRVKFCLRQEKEHCSASREAEVGPVSVKEASAVATPTLIAIVVSCVVFVLFASLLYVFCRCKKSRSKGKGKDYAAEPTGHPSLVTQPPPPYYASAESRPPERDCDTKPPLYGYHGGMPPGQNPAAGEWVNMGYMDNSYSNSNNGGSVNSQDSLWQMKMAAAGTGVGVPEGHRYGYDPIAHGGYTTATDDYAPYAHLDQARQDYDPADPYAPVHKAKKRFQPLDAPGYRDVSGLPDPYSDPMDCEESKPRHVSLSFDESLESGYSTPNSRNRRVIREIIV